MKYGITGVVDKVYQDTISMVIEADSEVEARAKAGEFLCEFPKPVTVVGVTKPYIDNRDYKYSKVVSIRVKRGKVIG